MPSSQLLKAAGCHILRGRINVMESPTTPIGRILVVDDEPLVCNSMKQMLSYLGHDVVTVTSGKEALTCLDQSPFDAVLIDYTMPEMKGDELAVVIKQRFQNLPIILVSASAEALQAAGNPLTGVDFIIGKPFALDELREVVARFISKKQ